MGSGGADGQEQEGACLNCGAALEGEYCHRCGQAAHVHRTFGAFWHDLSHSVLHFEGKMWRTLPLLFWRPGELTRRYSEGQRARFVSPVAMFLFSVFLMFAVFNTLGAYAYRNRSAPPKADAAAEDRGRSRPDSVGEFEQDFEAEKEENLSELSDLERARQRLLAAGKSSAPVDRDIAEIRAEMVVDQRLSEQAIALERAEARRAAAHRQPIEGISIHAGDDISLGWLDDSYARAKRNPKLLSYKLQSSAYKFSWALIPLMVPFLWLLFLHRRRYRRYKLYDHTVFVTYSLAFLSLWAIVLTLLKLAGLNGPVVLIPLLVPLAHLYRQLRGAYELSWWSALWRTLLLVIFAFIAGGLFFMLLLAMGVLG
jgi:hypothetical protein